MLDAEVSLAVRVARLETKLRKTSAVAAFSSALSILLVISGIGSHARAADANPQAKVLDHLRVHELDVVDGNGITRVKLGSPLPNATIAGRKLTRGGRPSDTISGMLLFDAEGVERSGYATADHGYSNVLLTLDDKQNQHAMFIAEPTGATTLRLFNAATQDRLDVAIDAEGPSISMIRRGKEVVRIPSN